jgi:hypothetical protein
MASSDVVNAILQLPGAGDALRFLQEQTAAFAYVPSRLQGIANELMAIRQQAAAQGDAGTVAQVDAALQGLRNVYSLYASASGNVAAVLSAVNGGSADVSIVPKLLSAAGQAALVLKSTQLFDDSVTQLSSGRLTAAQVAQLKRGGYSVQTTGQTIVKWLLIGGAVWAGWKLLGGSRVRRD